MVTATLLVRRRPATHPGQRKAAVRQYRRLEKQAMLRIIGTGEKVGLGRLSEQGQLLAGRLVNGAGMDEHRLRKQQAKQGIQDPAHGHSRYNSLTQQR